MLGPVCLTLSILAPRLCEDGTGLARLASAERPKANRLPIHHLVPWFILGFLGMIAARSFGLIPQAALAPIAGAATLLTVVSMAALGLGVDVRTVAKAGGRVTAAVVLSLVMLGAISFALITMLHLG
jgi:uncharacterized membrane protein YadS